MGKKDLLVNDQIASFLAVARNEDVNWRCNSFNSSRNLSAFSKSDIREEMASEKTRCNLKKESM